MSSTPPAIVTDSTADLPRELAQSRSVTVVPLTVRVGGEDYLDGLEITPERFYPLLTAGREPATTSQPSPARFEEAYRSLLDQHPSVLSVHISSRLSGTYAAARQAAQAVAPGRVQVIDSEQVSMALGLLVLAAADMAQRGAGLDDITPKLSQLGQAVRTVFTVSTLEYLRRGGRIGRASALVGSVLQVKPLLTIEAGEVAALERVRTYERALARISDLARAVDTGQGICAIVAHAASGEVAGRLADSIAPATESLLIQSLGPVVGAHAGPGAMGIACYPAELYPLRLGRPLAPASVA